MCAVCKIRGCFSSNGVISRVLLEKLIYSTFPANKELPPKWASTDSIVCFVGSKHRIRQTPSSQQLLRLRIARGALQSLQRTSKVPKKVTRVTNPGCSCPNSDKGF